MRTIPVPPRRQRTTRTIWSLRISTTTGEYAFTSEDYDHFALLEETWLAWLANRNPEPGATLTVTGITDTIDASCVHHVQLLEVITAMTIIKEREYTTYVQIDDPIPSTN